MCSSDELSVASRKASKLWFLLHVCAVEFLMFSFNHLPLMMHCLCKCLVTYPFTVMLKKLKADGWYLEWRRRQRYQTFVPKLSIMSHPASVLRGQFFPVQHTHSSEDINANMESSAQQEEAAGGRADSRLASPSHLQLELPRELPPSQGDSLPSFLFASPTVWSQAAILEGGLDAIFPLSPNTQPAVAAAILERVFLTFWGLLLLSLRDLTILYLLMICCYFLPAAVSLASKLLLFPLISARISFLLIGGRDWLKQRERINFRVFHFKLS